MKMKKLMITVAIVCATVAANAASWNWTQSGTSGKRAIWDNGASKTLYETTPSAIIYLFDAGVVAQDTLLSNLRAGQTIASQTSIKNTTIDSDSHFVDVSGFNYGEVKTYNYYMAVLDAAGNVYITDSLAVAGQESATKDISFTGMKTSSQLSYTDDAKATFADNGGGWYSTESVPEPTSGLLLLLGMAGLALRRRRA